MSMTEIASRHLPTLEARNPVLAALAIWAAFGAGSNVYEGLSAQEIVALLQHHNQDLVALTMDLVAREEPDFYTVDGVLARAARARDADWLAEHWLAPEERAAAGLLM